MTHLFSSLRTMGMCHSTDEDHTHPRVKTHERVIWHRPADLGSVDCDDIGSTGPFKGTWMRDPAGGGGGATNFTVKVSVAGVTVERQCGFQCVKQVLKQSTAL